MLSVSFYIIVMSVVMPNVDMMSAECHVAECWNAECCGAFSVIVTDAKTEKKNIVYVTNFFTDPSKFLCSG